MQKKKRQRVDGVVLLDKPQGITSNAAIQRVKRIFNAEKAGHVGTLDPMATGLLIILVGKATSASQYLMSLDKEYEGTVELGKVTNTQDAEGEVMETRPRFLPLTVKSRLPVWGPLIGAYLLSPVKPMGKQMLISARPNA